ncbi:hypothetical protein [Mucilaginibacter phyllosphaerae]|uniref:Uncharacterized protein n=1 Tax=Mucilaginibacter phyllosphaerae TaxID=1812349 RepID=A0A4Y8AD74_9SPHI|nr:hypothetical protein [Mucilaginibacter phyllosphaerae]MBB3969249.1 hypothetical protein [Mucilaginibacter phyllosphaerae]TEW65952.1 hypothetical protein E2R65_12545 [Mucilaginibacter phyllosphaerae]GGH07225.1 hypothetical protein GCM10007352_11850 [Mucilaginibacter phyllosphaerae]
MENKPEGFDRANGQGQNHDIAGNVANVANENIRTNTDSDEIDKGSEPNVQDKPDDTRVKTVTPGNDNGDPGPDTEQDASNKGKGPSGENL